MSTRTPDSLRIASPLVGAFEAPDAEAVVARKVAAVLTGVRTHCAWCERGDHRGHMIRGERPCGCRILVQALPSARCACERRGGT